MYVYIYRRTGTPAIMPLIICRSANSHAPESVRPPNGRASGPHHALRVHDRDGRTNYADARFFIRTTPCTHAGTRWSYRWWEHNAHAICVRHFLSARISFHEQYAMRRIIRPYDRSLRKTSTKLSPQTNRVYGYLIDSDLVFVIYVQILKKIRVCR